MNTVTTLSHRRIDTFDLLRGYFLVVILIDHFARYPGIFDLFTGRGMLWVSAAEGFFIVSGIMVGLVRGNEAKRGEFVLAWKRLWKRALTIYIWSAVLILLFTAIGLMLTGNPGVKSGIAESLSIATIIKTLTFQYSYGWADFLPFYAVYIALAPLALWLIHKRQAWLVALIALIIWWYRGTNPFLAWQVVFFLGMIFG